MSSVSITEILGSDSVSGSRNTINSNFIILQNWINSYSNKFGIDLNNGVLDLTSQTTGKISAKTAAFNSVQFPSSGTSLASISSTGVGTFSSVSTTALTASGNVTLQGPLSSTSSVTISSGGTANLNGETNVNGVLKFGSSASLVDGSQVYNTGLTAGSEFPDADAGTSPQGGGISTSSGSPYSITGTESVIYADLENGLYLSVGTGATASVLPAGLVINIVNTSDSGGTIYTGVQGANYTGFNTNASQGGFASAGITVSSGKAYRSSLRLMWEPRIDSSSSTQKGSWVVLSSTNTSV